MKELSQSMRELSPIPQSGDNSHAVVKDADYRVLRDRVFGNPFHGITSIFSNDDMKVAWAIGFGMGAMVALAIARLIL